ncbi:hypothetical protein Droror1_Dr00020295, partial [Drosera rotundifolia]
VIGSHQTWVSYIAAINLRRCWPSSSSTRRRHSHFEQLWECLATKAKVFDAFSFVGFRPKDDGRAAVPIEDVRDAKELQSVELFRQALVVAIWPNYVSLSKQLQKAGKNMVEPAAQGAIQS